MEIFDDVVAQMEATRLPLYAVSATAAHSADSPLYLFLHWHGFQRSTPLQLPGISIPARPVQSSLLKVEGPWYSDLLRDELVLELAWRLGAWDVTRIRARGCNQIGAPSGEALQCRQASEKVMKIIRSHSTTHHRPARRHAAGFPPRLLALAVPPGQGRPVVATGAGRRDAGQRWRTHRPLSGRTAAGGRPWPPDGLPDGPHHALDPAFSFVTTCYKLLCLALLISCPARLISCIA